MCHAQPIVIADCGEISEGQDDGCVIDDGTGDTLNPFPEDSDFDFIKVHYTVDWHSIGAAAVMTVNAMMQGCDALEDVRHLFDWTHRFG